MMFKDDDFQQMSESESSDMTEKQLIKEEVWIC
jgi:hypothetical protein